jgi:hypothetical protein
VCAGKGSYRPRLCENAVLVWLETPHRGKPVIAKTVFNIAPSRTPGIFNRSRTTAASAGKYASSMLTVLWTQPP